MKHQNLPLLHTEEQWDRSSMFLCRNNKLKNDTDERLYWEKKPGVMNDKASEFSLKAFRKCLNRNEAGKMTPWCLNLQA